MQPGLSPSISKAIDAANTPRVRELIAELDKYGLAVALPHIHKMDVVEPLPHGMVQLETNLHVSFQQAGTINKNESFPVMWRLGATGQMEACAWCVIGDQH